MIHHAPDSGHSHEIEIRVRYQETDGQRRVHHGNYLTYFEMGRTEMLRAQGFDPQSLNINVSEAQMGAMVGNGFSVPVWRGVFEAAVMAAEGS